VKPVLRVSYVCPLIWDSWGGLRQISWWQASLVWIIGTIGWVVYMRHELEDSMNMESTCSDE
jgi:hypothetical protein